MPGFPHYTQPDHKDCGPTSLKIIAKYYGKTVPLARIRKLSETTRTGSSLLSLSDAAEYMGLRSTGLRLSFEDLKEVSLPCIVHWEEDHFLVVYKIKGSWVYLSDPARGFRKLSIDAFIEGWMGKNATKQTAEGIVLLLEPSPDFYQREWEKEEKGSFRYLFRYIYQYRNLVWQLVWGLLAASILQFILPFLTQSIVDIGIQQQDIHFVYLILLAQVMLFLGRAAIEIVRSWVLLHLSTRINIALISDFFIKLMRLPIGFFNTRITGDILQRINDHKRIEQLLTNTSLNTLFSLFNLLVFSFVLGFYSLKILLIFFIGSVCYLGWIFFFLRRRREIDYQRFNQVAAEQSKVIELINGMQEIKLHNAERQNRWRWEFIQIKLFRVAMRSLSLEQTQRVGAQFIDQLKNIGITVTSALLVISGELTLGMMLAVQYIIGQLNGPIQQLFGFIQAAQDANISLERLGEIHLKADEEQLGVHESRDISGFEPIEVENLAFRYPGTDKLVLEGLNLLIPPQKVTAIVGASGSGKTTLMKLLLKFYEPTEGDIKLGNASFYYLSHRSWRAHCGAVMQEGYIFNDTIAQNIAVNEDYIDKERLRQAVEIANIKDFIEKMPRSYNTKIGNEGTGLSTGQKQRILIARSVYKNPDFLFFDEATSALDTENERIIMENLQRFFKGRTVVVIAHRLSTVRHADQIVVLESGKIVEKGTHEELSSNQGNYYQLVKNQLEL